MPFAPPLGTELAGVLGSGTFFEVALVGAGDAVPVCKRLTPRMLAEPTGRAALVREAKVLALAKHPALPALVRVGADQHGPFLLETRADGVPLTHVVESWRALGKAVPQRFVGHVMR